MSNNNSSLDTLLLKLIWTKSNLITNLDYIEMICDDMSTNLFQLNNYLEFKTTYTPIEGELGKRFLKDILDANNIKGNEIQSLDIFSKDYIRSSKLYPECIKADNMIDDDYVNLKKAYIVENMKPKINKYLEELND